MDKMNDYTDVLSSIRCFVIQKKIMKTRKWKGKNAMCEKRIRERQTKKKAEKT